jgi:anti-anti-sigma factor
VEVAIEDFGVWRPAPVDPGFRGRGLLLIRRLAEDVTFEPTPGGGTTVRFRVPVRPGRSEGVTSPRRPATAPLGSAGGATLVRTGDGVIRLAGELDLASAEVVGPQLLALVAAATPGRLDVDLSGVTYLASAGVGLLLAAQAEARARDAVLRLVVEPGGAAARILELAGLAGLIDAG